MSGERPRTVAVIQARMGSTRLPGKMLEPLAGRPLLHHIIRRTQAISLADEVVLATSVLPRDDALAELAGGLSVRSVRGSEDDVLARFMLALEGTGAELVVRVCGDAPLFDPVHVDRALAALAATGSDLVRWADPGVRTAYMGAGVISMRALRWTWERGREDPLAREHVTAYAAAHAAELRTTPIEPDPRLVGDFALSIDTAEDLQAVRRVYERLYRPGAIVSLVDAVALIRADESGELARLVARPGR